MRLWLYCLAGFVFDWVLYVLWTVIPFHAEALHATPDQVGYLQAVSSVVYVFMCILVGRLSDRFSKGSLLRVGCLITAAACVLIGRSESYLMLLLLAPVAGLGASLFWPPIQGAIGAEAKPETLEKSIGLFNILWSTGKALGFLTAGAIHRPLGTSSSLLLAAGGAVLVVLFYPWRDAKGSPTLPEDPVDPGLRTKFLRMAWVANFVLFGVGSLITIHYFKFVHHHQIGVRLLGSTEKFFGLYLGLIYLSQTLVFVVLSRTSKWTYKRGILYGTHLVLAIAMILVAFVRSELAILATAPLVGIGLGFGYCASIYYSLHTPKGHGKYSGMHEAVLGSGTFLLPLVAGLLARSDLRWPYWLAAACAVVAVLVEERIFWQDGRTP